MLITKLKPEEEIRSVLPDRVFLLSCRGCAEVSFPEAEAAGLTAKLLAEGKITGVLDTDYICDPEKLRMRLRRRVLK